MEKHETFASVSYRGKKIWGICSWFFLVILKQVQQNLIFSDLYVVTTSFLWLSWLRLVRFLRSHNAISVICYKLLPQIVWCKLAFLHFLVNFTKWLPWKPRHLWKSEFHIWYVLASLITIRYQEESYLKSQPSNQKFLTIWNEIFYHSFILLIESALRDKMIPVYRFSISCLDPKL